jgi:hypothetical protein
MSRHSAGTIALRFRHCIREDIVSFHLHAVRAGSETIDAMTVTVVRVVTQYDNPSSSSSSPNEHAAEGG